MSAFTAINLEKLPAPSIIDLKDFETVFAEVKAYLIDREPELELVLNLESEPMTKLLQAWAYREILLRNEVNDAGRGNMLAFAGGAQLDHLAAFYGVSRAIVQEADDDAVPPVEEILEDDGRFRARIQLALEGFTTAGPRGSYIFWGLTASAEVKDIGVESPTPGQVLVTVLSADGTGVAGADLVTTVEETLNGEDVRPLTDQVVVQPATVIDYTLDAVLTLYDGPDAELVRSNAEEKALAFVEEHHRLGHDINISGLHAALHQPGVQRVDLVSPAADIVVGSNEAAHCGAVAVAVGGRDV